LIQNNPNSSEPEAHKNRARKWAENLNLRSRNRCISLVLVGFLLLSTFTVYRLVSNKHQSSFTASANLQPELASTSLLPQLKEIVGHFEPNQTITEALQQHGLSTRLIYEIVDCARPIYDLAKIGALKPYFINFTQDGVFRDFRYPVNNQSYLTVYHDMARDQLVPVMKDYQYEIRTANISGVIQSSLYNSIVEIGEQYQLAIDLAEIFGYDIDFNTDIQKGDSFRALVEKKYLDGEFVKNGAVLAASVSNKGKVYTGFLFEDESGKPAYYAADGQALKRSFLKSPLKVFRITSGFSYARKHPILKVVRPHLGVDYAAPVGSPVQAVSSGVVISAGRKGANGNMIHLRHAGGYETKYLHLSKINVKVGARVDQGQVIGNVGSSGLSTGPHLDFRISRHGKPLNPTKLIFPPAKPVAPEKLDRFVALRDKLIDEVQITNSESQLAQR
jgi:murein DD-endopeptidase MepM/ murein hydrolase activator NlpD